MLTKNTSQSLADILYQRRQRLSKLIDFPAVLWSGSRSPRNFAANAFPFRASSHFLYFAGLPLPNAAIRLEADKLELFLDEAAPSSALWYGETPTVSEIAEQIGADAAYPLEELNSRLQGVATIAVQDATTWTQQSQLLDRWILPQTPPQGIDLTLVQAIIKLRLIHDKAALTELRKAADITVLAHKAGMRAVKTDRKSVV